MWFVKCAVGRGPRGRSTGGMGSPSARGHEVRVQMGPDGGSAGGPGEGSTGGSGGWRSVGVQIVGAQGAQGAAVQDGLGGTRVF